MTALLWPFQWLALVGFCASVVVHLMALLQIAVPVVLQPYINEELYATLGLGIFVVWMPAVLAASQVARTQDAGGVSWNILLKGSPAWMLKALKGLFVYVVLNFFVSIWLTTNAQVQDGVFLQRTFSGHWLLFYGAAFAILYSVTRRPALMERRLCAAGHTVRHEDSFCPTCGQPMPRED